ncbi:MULTISPECIES: Imm26 family immunity protein [unclassified Pseudomonas]|uniref:Imm26 family immunity protein n=1 Tax=unclassified Pseudomonas TaxID=196821 RepID=UPI00244B7C54|nr:MULTISPECIES: Imm26 family immunity protein [unclassified Pseudomonas]MDH0895719.1 immunity 26/phosphotriesterase HocA family protein [Pseudomonas sp. GD03875]MDH1066633.1 immunity 26/phosphotriesterase HocA family protein [Pseudomonas sp. GD03985]
MKIKAKDVVVGDVLGFPVGDGIYAFARVLFEVTGMCCLVEIFNYQGVSLEFNDEIISSPRLVEIQNVSRVSILSREWGGAVVHRDPDFKPDLQELRGYEIMNGNQVIRYDMDWTPDCGRMRWIVVRVPGREGISDAEYKKIKKSYPSGDVILNNYMLIEMIRQSWRLEPYQWESGKEMWAWFRAHGVYHERPPRVRGGEGS